MPCAATATPSPTCSDERAKKRSGISERGQHAVASGKIAVGVDRLQTDVRGAGREVRPQAAPDRLGVTPEYHRIDEPVTAAVGQLSLGKALTEPTVAII